MGVSGRAILDAIVAGQTDSTVMAELAKRRLRSKREKLKRLVKRLEQLGHRVTLESQNSTQVVSCG
ncbi:hypothetical protein H6G27_23150 [Nostoc linckia FACHB-104]|nr:hypothetical protein [Nostoc linckia FACHB-104]